ncbi:MAG: DUF87 domain-containing protein [Nitrososphaerota archaeon]|nr:DUF87 domain-containing protein [Candidatus Calditenuaceae archaeon]MDW8072674.1 DUF87 domain-containing protein [Nitrososphaerota archaeon]
MKILRKSNGTFEILALPGDAEIERGEYIAAVEGDRALILEVIDVEYADIPGLLEDLLRELTLQKASMSVYDPHGVNSITISIRESKIIVAKLRTVIWKDDVKFNSLWIPSRFSSKIRRIPTSEVLRYVRGAPLVPIEIGESFGEEVTIDATAFDNSLTIITGRKGTGKSHCAKVLLYELAKRGCYCLVFDINGEYCGLGEGRRGESNEVSGRVVVARPCINFRAGIKTIGLEVMMDILEHVFATPQNSLREFARIWEELEGRGLLSVDRLLSEVRRAHMNEAVRDALLSRLHALFSSEFIVDGAHDPIYELFHGRPDGALVVIDLSKLRPHVRRVVVEYVLSRVTRHLSENLIPPLFLVSEEAHLYVGETYWEDIVTRMRHLGVSPIFITNQPDSIPELIYRQADNLFLFNFLNENDLEALSKFSHVDSETVKKIAPALGLGEALIVGSVVGNVPILVKIRDIDAKVLGASKRFFRRAEQKV